MPTISTASITFENFNILKVDVGTNCPCGGDTGHGGRTLLRFTNEGSTDMRVRIDGGAQAEARSIELVFGGDAECQTLIQSLEFALDFLKTSAANTLYGHEETVE